MKKIKSLGSILVLLAVCTAILAGQIENADHRTIPGQSDLGTQVSRMMDEDQAWIMWSFTRVPETRVIYGDHDPCAVVLGEKQHRSMTLDSDESAAVLLEVKAGTIVDVALISAGCAINGNGRILYQITNVDAGAGIEVLSALLADSYSEKVNQGALTTIALHRDANADGVLTSVVDGNGSRSLSEQAIFWMGEARGETGLQNLQHYAVSADEHLRESVAFGLNVSRQPGALDTLFDMAREDASDEVRGKAVFWLAQKDAPGVMDLIDGILARSSGNHLTEQAIFALAQVPAGKGNARLKQLATDHENGEIRARALFWLAQQGGEEALSLLTGVLAGNPDEKETDNALMLLSQIRTDEGSRLLLATARNHAQSKIRSKALFWLGQSAGEKITETLATFIDEDPDLEVKKQAVFSISQRPHDEAVPMLAKLVREHRNAEVRKQAIFWLSQIGGDAALAVIEEVLEQ